MRVGRACRDPGLHGCTYLERRKEDCGGNPEFTPDRGERETPTGKGRHRPSYVPYRSRSLFRSIFFLLDLFEFSFTNAGKGVFFSVGVPSF